MGAVIIIIIIIIIIVVVMTISAAATTTADDGDVIVTARIPGCRHARGPTSGMSASTVSPSPCWGCSPWPGCSETDVAQHPHFISHSPQPRDSLTVKASNRRLFFT